MQSTERNCVCNERKFTKKGRKKKERIKAVRIGSARRVSSWTYEAASGIVERQYQQKHCATCLDPLWTLVVEGEK